MKPEFKISLLENGIHSFNKGLDTFIAYEEGNRKDRFQLKEAIMFLHHGIELLLKQTLIKHGGEYLIFSNILKDTVTKVIKAKRENISVFNLERPVHTATYLDVIERVKAFVDVELSEALEKNLIALNQYRNNIEHYGIETDADIASTLLEIRTPISKFFKDVNIELGGGNENRWNKLEEKELTYEISTLNDLEAKELRYEVSTLRYTASIKKFELQGDLVIIEYVDNFDEHKKLKPESKITEAEWETYWSTHNQIVKALNGGSVKLIKNLIFVNRVKIKLPFKDNVYSIDISRTDVEEYLGCTFEQIREEWTSKFAALIVHDKEFSTKFFERFGIVKKIE